MKNGFLALLMLTLMTAFTHKKQRRIVFFGDSITQAAVQSGGYIDLLQQDFSNKPHGTAPRLIGAGISGNKIYDLYFRLDDDVLSHKPDLVVIYVGINDVWHKKTHQTGTDPDRYDRFYRRMIEKIQKKGAKVVVCTPTVIGEKNVNELDEELDRYAAIVRKIADDMRLPLVDLRAEFTQYIAQHNPDNLASGVLTTDGVHLNDRGNRLVADCMSVQLK